ncbi:MAG: Gfo/Idh/MocA family oxidoreductase [Cytophagales bacterium]|nr:Gfo/Idh/MocA family oxidoreductase [Cytophagales bacterium]
MKTPLNRRKFIKAGAVAAAGAMIVPRHVLGGPGYIAPSDKLNLAAIGAGGKGFGDIRNAYNEGKENVVALCDVDSKQAGRSIKMWPDATFYSDFRRMLEENKDIDAVTISTPDHTHGVAAMAAMQLGKHVYVQKPLTHNIKEARMLTEAAREYKIVSQMGNQGASHPGQVQMRAWFDSGIIGTVDRVEAFTNRPVWPQGIPVPKEAMELPGHLSKEDWDLFIGPADYVDYHPLYHPFKWRGWWNFGTGALGDMGCHLIDPAFKTLGLGYPTEVECSVGQVYTRDWVPEYIPEGCPPSSRIQLKFPATDKNASDVTLVWCDGGIKPFIPDLVPSDMSLFGGGNNGTMLIGTKGIMTCNTYGRDPKVFLNSGEILEMSKDFGQDNPYAGMPELGHQVAWTDAIKAGFNSKEHQALTSSFDYAGPLTESVLMGNLAIRSYQYGTLNKDGGRDYNGRMKLLWDGENMNITNFEKANDFVGRKYRAGWEL